MLYLNPINKVSIFHHRHFLKVVMEIKANNRSVWLSDSVVHIINSHTLSENEAVYVECKKICLSQTFKRFALYKYFSGFDDDFSAISLFALVSSNIFISLGGCLCVGKMVQTVWQLCVSLSLSSHLNQQHQQLYKLFSISYSITDDNASKKFREFLPPCQNWSSLSLNKFKWMWMSSHALSWWCSK